MNITEFNGYRKINFTVGGRESFIVCPENALPGKPWVWRAEYFSAFNAADMELLKKGWHLAYHRATNMFGSPAAVEYFKEFYDTVVPAFGLSEKTVLFGFSVGGLYSVNYALKYPETVAALYLDAPVLDIKSWPGGKGIGNAKTDYPEFWGYCLEAYGFDEETAVNYKENPLDRTEELAALNIPVIIVAGDSDATVPAVENCIPFSQRFVAAGGTFKMIMKPGCDHHPHSLQNTTPITEFIEKMI